MRGSLEAGLPLQRVELPMAGGQALYELKGLKKQQGYEVKISFPGTVSSAQTLGSQCQVPESLSNV